MAQACIGIGSPASRGRGLKLCITATSRPPGSTSPASRGRGLKLAVEPMAGGMASPASRGRGLKPVTTAKKLPIWQGSPASRGRGLKLALVVGNHRRDRVARFTRAWIETSLVSTPCAIMSPASRGRGLKHLGAGDDDHRFGRPLHAGVD